MKVTSPKRIKLIQTLINIKNLDKYHPNLFVLSVVTLSQLLITVTENSLRLPRNLLTFLDLDLVFPFKLVSVFLNI